MEGILIVGPTETEMARQVGFQPMGLRMSCAFRLTGRKQHAQPQPPKSTSLSAPNEEELAQATCLADEGNIEASLILCHRYLELHGPAPDLLFLMGTLALAERRLEEAEEYFRRTIYLAPDQYEGLINLALLAERRGDKKSAELFWKRARKHAG